jgi:hypothetical protein
MFGHLQSRAPVSPERCPERPDGWPIPVTVGDACMCTCGACAPALRAVTRAEEPTGNRASHPPINGGESSRCLIAAASRARSLTVVELDERFVGFLRQNAPHAKVLRGDALEIIRSFSFDVLIGNLPHKVTESLISVMPGLSFRTAILSVGESTDLSPLDCAFSGQRSRELPGTISFRRNLACHASSR